MSVIEEEEKDGMYGKAIKGALTERASIPYKGRSAGRRKKVEKGRERGGSTCGQATRSAARIEKEFGGRVKEESKEVLW